MIIKRFPHGQSQQPEISVISAQRFSSNWRFRTSGFLRDTKLSARLYENEKIRSRALCFRRWEKEKKQKATTTTTQSTIFFLLVHMVRFLSLSRLLARCCRSESNNKEIFRYHEILVCFKIFTTFYKHTFRTLQIARSNDDENHWTIFFLRPERATNRRRHLMRQVKLFTYM